MRKILWVDLETTGLDSHLDTVLEVGLRITDWEGHNLDEVTSLVWVEHWRPRLVQNEFVFNMHAESGLLSDMEDLDRHPRRFNLRPMQVSNKLTEWVSERLGRDTNNFMPMAGNSVHMDRSFMLYHMPELHGVWSYRNLDMSAIREACRLFNPKLFAKLPVPPKVHRPQADIDQSISLMNWLQENFLFVED